MTGPTGKILIVDDEARLRFFIKEALLRDGHNVVDVERGETALELAATEAFDVALIDLNLPGIHGIDVLKQLRQLSPDTVIIVLTAHASLDTSVEALRQGAHDYLFKPAKTVELRDSIRRGLLKRQQTLKQRNLLRQLEQLAVAIQDTTADNQPPSAQPATTPATEPPAAGEETGRFLQKAGFTVDLTRHLITCNDHLLELSPTEFNLLAYLISEAPRVLSPQELLKEVQGYETEQWAASEIIRQHVSRIRRKIKSGGGESSAIQTVRGVGYTISG